MGAKLRNFFVRYMVNRVALIRRLAPQHYDRRLVVFVTRAPEAVPCPRVALGRSLAEPLDGGIVDGGSFYVIVEAEAVLRVGVALVRCLAPPLYCSSLAQVLPVLVDAHRNQNDTRGQASPSVVSLPTRSVPLIPPFVRRSPPTWICG